MGHIDRRDPQPFVQTRQTLLLRVPLGWGLRGPGGGRRAPEAGQGGPEPCVSMASDHPLRGHGRHRQPGLTVEPVARSPWSVLGTTT
jgi:hypothetical protein